MAEAEDAIARLQGVELQGAPVKLEIQPVSYLYPATLCHMPHLLGVN
jgi:hypothetical protein